MEGEQPPRQPELPPLGVALSKDIQFREDRPNPYTARVRWVDPVTGKRKSRAESSATAEESQAWLDAMERAAHGGTDPETANMTLADYGHAVMELALRGLENKTRDPYLAGWRKRIVPDLGHLLVRRVTTGAVDRTVHNWIEAEVGRSSIKNSLAMLVRIMDQAVRDGIREDNPARIPGWQHHYGGEEDELENPRDLALPNWQALTDLATALVEASADKYPGWGDIVIFAACTAARIGEVSGVRARHIDTKRWIWTVRTQTTPGPGGLADKRTKSKRARRVPLIPEVRPLVEARLQAVGDKPGARLFTGPRGGRVDTKVLRRATHWDEVVEQLGYPHLRRHDLRHTGLTWMADGGVPLHVLRKIAGHGSLSTTQRYLHVDEEAIHSAGEYLSTHLGMTPRPDQRPGSEEDEV